MVRISTATSKNHLSVAIFTGPPFRNSRISRIFLPNRIPAKNFSSTGYAVPAHDRGLLLQRRNPSGLSDRYLLQARRNGLWQRYRRCGAWQICCRKALSILEDIGNWLSTNGEAIYRSRPWRYTAEGPTQEVEGQFSDSSATEYTGSDFRFTAGNGCIYATCLRYPGDGQIRIKSLAKSKDPNKPAFHGIITDVEILGFEEKPEFCIDENGLRFATKTVQSAFPVVLKIHTD